MKICLSIISDGWGGAEKVVHELAEKLVMKGHAVTLLVNEETRLHFENIEGVRIVSIGPVFNLSSLVRGILLPAMSEEGGSSYQEVDGGVLAFISSIIRPLYLFRISRLVRDSINRERYDIIHSNLENSDILMGFVDAHSTRTVTTIHGLHLPTLMSKGNKGVLVRLRDGYKGALLKKALNKMYRMVFVSEWMRRSFETYLLPNARHSVIYNGIEISDLDPHRIAPVPLMGDLKVLFPGGDKVDKGLDIVIMAMSRLREKVVNARLYVAGTMEPNESIRELIAANGLEDNVTFLGFLPPPEYRSILRSVDILCMPAKNEAFGLVFLEAMAMGKPVVATSLGGIPEVVKDGRNGLLVDRTPESVASAIVRIFSDEKLRKQMEQNDESDIKRFSWDESVEGYLRVYSNR